MNRSPLAQSEPSNLYNFSLFTRIRVHYFQGIIFGTRQHSLFYICILSITAQLIGHLTQEFSNLR